MATRIMQTILRNPQTGTPLCGWKTTVRLVVPSFDSEHYEVIRSSTITSALSTDETPGLLSVELEVNTDIPKPTGTYYTWNVASGITNYFQVPAGDADTPEWVDDWLIVDPTQPIPAGAASEADFEAFESTVAGEFAALPGTYARRIFLAQDADGVYFPAQSAGMAVDADGTYYFSAGFAAVAQVAIDADGVPYPVAIGA